MTAHQILKKSEGRCISRCCRNDAAPGKSICHKCRSRAYKKHHPVEYTYNYLRNNARRRSIPFLLTLTDFRHFCNKTSYLDLKGKTADSASIDRIDNNAGYTLENIRVLTLSENSVKRNTVDYPF